MNTRRELQRQPVGARPNGPYIEKAIIRSCRTSYCLVLKIYIVVANLKNNNSPSKKETCHSRKLQEYPMCWCGNHVLNYTTYIYLYN